jgi:hypothetical protein
MTTLAFAPAVSTGVALVQLNEALWRITRPDGEVLGYVEQFVDRGETRFRAKLMLAAKRRFISIGEFWVMDDAVDCFR